jgi:hypothetical protein
LPPTRVFIVPQGKKTVGTVIHMRHLREIDRARLVFDVVVYDAFEKISEGVNERFIVSVEKFLEKVRKKRVKG